MSCKRQIRHCNLKHAICYRYTLSRRAKLNLINFYSRTALQHPSFGRRGKYSCLIPYSTSTGCDLPCDFPPFLAAPDATTSLVARGRAQHQSCALCLCGTQILLSSASPEAVWRLTLVTLSPLLRPHYFTHTAQSR